MLIVILVNSIVDILGLSAILPVIGLVVAPEKIEANPVTRSLFEVAQSFGVGNRQEFLMTLCVLLIAAFLFKALFGLSVNLLQSRFSFGVSQRITSEVWTHYFTQSIEDLGASNSGQILAKINSWPVSFARSFMVGSLMILNESLVISIIVFILLFYNWVVFLSIACILILGALVIRRTTRGKLTLYSRVRKDLEPRTNTLVTNAISGYLEIITFRASAAIQTVYLKGRKQLFRILGNSLVLNLAPSKLYEVLAVIAVAGSILIALTQEAPESGLIELLSLMAISAYRVMPSMTRINIALNQMRGEAHILEAFEEVHCTRSENVPASPVNTSELGPVDIDIQDLSLAYQGSNSNVLVGLSHAFKAGRLAAIVGPSGSGKSTLIRAIMGLHRPVSGEISVKSATQTTILHENLKSQEWLANISYVSQQPFLFEGTLRDNLCLTSQNVHLDETKINTLVDRLNLRSCLGDDHMNFQITENGNNLSGGQKQRIAILRALQLDRPLVVLDEATSALDEKLRDVVLELLQEKARNGCNIILVTHDEELSAQCDVVLELLP
ncbi:MAG: hypothetical protein CMC99_05785 [Flavobacteriales bacterium]|nr:hypothetical protein [Flavobacteriales bacterium]